MEEDPPPSLVSWLNRLTEAPNAAIILYSQKHSKQEPERQLSVADAADQPHQDPHLMRDIQIPRVWEQFGTDAMAWWQRRFELHAWPTKHAWLDTKYHEGTPLSEVVKKITRLTLVVSLEPHESLQRWVDVHNEPDSLVLLHYLESLKSLRICIVKWEHNELNRSNTQGPRVTELNFIHGLDNFLSWLHRHISPDVPVNFVKPEHLHDLAGAGRQRKLYNYSFLDPKVGTEEMQFTRLRDKKVRPDSHDARDPAHEKSDRDRAETERMRKKNSRRRLREQRQLPTRGQAGKKRALTAVQRVERTMAARERALGRKPYRTPGFSLTGPLRL